MKTNTIHWAGITAGILSLAGYASAATLGSEKYTYDASGNIIEKSIDGVVTCMAYDQANRLIERQTAGQAKQTTAYDNAGRPVTELNADGQTTRSLSYGYGDKVLEALTRDCKAGFYYNAEGQLVGKKVGGSLSTYTWDGNVLAADGAESFSNEAHVTGGVPVLTSGRDVVVSDHLGNTLASGAKQFTSTAYGEGLEQGRFTGKAYINELGCYVFNHRFYSPETSRWTVADPSGYPNGMNNSAYVNGDPMSRVDSVGLDFLLFNGQTITLYDGYGYDEESNNGTVFFGDIVQIDNNPLQWTAISHPTKAENLDGGKTPQGWYSVGAMQEENELVYHATTPIWYQNDHNENNTKYQGAMVLWGDENGNNFGTDVGSGTARTAKTTPTNSPPPQKTAWKCKFGENWYDTRKNSSNVLYTWPSARTKPSIKIHPEGGYYGTLGCIGIVNYSEADSFHLFLTQNQYMQIFVEY